VTSYVIVVREGSAPGDGAQEGVELETPKIISVDDHVVEPPGLWQERLPTRFRDVGPRVERRQGAIDWIDGKPTWRASQGLGAGPVDVWLYEDLVWPLPRGMGQSGFEHEPAYEAITYDRLLPACYDQAARLEAMDRNHTEASVTFPSFPRFCGQTFLEASDKELALLCVRAYNDWMIDEWGGGAGHGRLIPQVIVPLWDVGLAAVEVRRCAAKGAHAVTFSEQPVHLGLPSIYSGYWEPLWQACEDTATTVSIHIGSSSRMPTTSPDAPPELDLSINCENAINAFCDWLISGVLHRFGSIKLALSEGQVGWMPFFLERMDLVWRDSHMYSQLKDRLPEPPSHYVPGRVYGCIFNDPVGLRNRDLIGMGQIMLETDFPHADSTYPRSRELAEETTARAGLDDHERWQLLRGNAIECFGLQRFGIAS
jgi:predicted TIM-barrel fold metal-dependent hydrolase